MFHEGSELQAHSCNAQELVPANFVSKALVSFAAKLEREEQSTEVLEEFSGNAVRVLVCIGLGYHVNFQSGFQAVLPGWRCK